MKTNIYLNNENYLSGMTLKDEQEFEENNMALHACINPECVISNRKKLASLLNCELDNFVCANQTHSSNFHKVMTSDTGRGAKSIDNAIMDTDALYTYESNLLLGSFSADCVPLTFYNEKNGLIGVVHSGWQGTIKEITIKLFEHLKQMEGCNPNDFHVHIGAAISQEKFEVDEDVYLKFKNLGYADDFIYFNENRGKYHISNQQTVKKQCELVGVPAEQITIDETCTYISPDGFSYRQDKKAGRHLSFIMKKSTTV